MNVIILSAGYATRLYPLTKTIPKQLLNVGNKKILEHIVTSLNKFNLATNSISEKYLVVNNTFYEQFKKWNKPEYNLKIINNGVNTNETRKGAIGDLKYVIEKEKISDDVLIIGGDNLYGFELEKMYNFFKEKGNSIAVYDLKDKNKLANKFGVVELDNMNKIIGFEEKPSHPKTSLTATLVYMLKKESVIALINYLNKNKHQDNAGHMIEWLATNKTVYGWKFKDYWFDIGSFGDLEKVRQLFL